MSPAERTRWLLKQSAAGLHGRKLPLRFLVEAINRTAKERKDQAFADFAERHAHNPDRPPFERHRFFLHLQAPVEVRKALLSAETKWRDFQAKQEWSNHEQEEQHAAKIDILEHELLGTVDLGEKERCFQELLDEISAQTGLVNQVDVHGSVWLAHGTSVPWRLAVAPAGGETQKRLVECTSEPITLKRWTLVSALEVFETGKHEGFRFLCDPACGFLGVNALLYGEHFEQDAAILSGVTGTTAHILKDGLVFFTERPSFVWRDLDIPRRPKLAQELAQIPVPEIALNRCPLRDALALLEAHGMPSVIGPRSEKQMAVKISLSNAHNTNVARELEVIENLYGLSFEMRA